MLHLGAGVVPLQIFQEFMQMLLVKSDLITYGSYQRTYI